MPTVFECGNQKCAYAIAADGLNAIQLKALRMWAKTCPKCNQSTKWLEQLALLDTKTLPNKTDGGSINVLPIKPTRPDLPKSASQRLRAARYDGIH